jgi:uncharacterized protein (DUF1810 family)
MLGPMPDSLERFVQAQDPVYEAVRSELGSGGSRPTGWGSGARDILGSPDEPRLGRALDRFYEGRRDPLTLEILERSERV